MALIRAIAAGVLLAATAARGDDAAATARVVMREALREQAPLPTRLPSLPERGAPAPLGPRQDLAGRQHDTERQRDAERAAGAHAHQDATRRAETTHAGAANRAAMQGAMGLSHDASGCDEHAPAEMMREMGRTGPGGTMGPGTGTPGGHATGGDLPGTPR